MDRGYLIIVSKPKSNGTSGTITYNLHSYAVICVPRVVEPSGTSGTTDSSSRAICFLVSYINYCIHTTTFGGIV